SLAGPASGGAQGKCGRGGSRRQLPGWGSEASGGHGGGRQLPLFSRSTHGPGSRQSGKGGLAGGAMAPAGRRSRAVSGCPRRPLRYHRGGAGNMEVARSGTRVAAPLAAAGVLFAPASHSQQTGAGRGGPPPAESRLADQDEGRQQADTDLQAAIAFSRGGPF